MKKNKKEEITTLLIKTLLFLKSKSQRDLAKKFKVTESLISQAISGKPKPMPILQQKLINYLRSL
jgi:transcriptional regulator with XRE-family HTH domain